MSKKNNNRRLCVLLLAMFVAATQSVVRTMATDITGVTGNNGVYNIDPSGILNGAGFRDYTNFTLDKGDIANLIYKYGNENISTFVNLVDNQININGIVNTMRDGSFYAGEAVFVSPNGMVVGPSGVLNVGSLSVLTPTAPGMNMYKKGTASLEELGYHGNADVTINGKVLSRGDVQMVARALSLGADSVVLGGVSGNEVLIDTNTAADSLFNSLVNTGSSGKSANIDIRTYRSTGGFDAAGTLQNLGDGDLIIENRGGTGMNIANTANISNANGSLYLVNADGDMNINGTIENNGDYLYLTNGVSSGYMNIDSSAVINSNSGAKIYNRSSEGLILDGTINNTGAGLAITNEQGLLNISSGTINNTNADMNITSQGAGLMFGTNSEINSSGEIMISNKGSNGTFLSGNITNTGNTYITEAGGILSINGKINNNNGELVIAGNGTGVTVGSNAVLSNDGRLVLVNTGANGLTMNGTVNNAGGTAITNRAGDFVVNGTVNNTSGKINLTNTGNSLKVNSGAQINGSGEEVLIQNTGSGGFTMDGTVTNTGKTYLQNTNGAMAVNGTVNNANDVLYIGNTGSGLTIGQDAVLTNNGSTQILNTGADGLKLNGTIYNDGDTTVSNRAGDMVVNSTVSNDNGTLYLSNSGNALNITKDAVISGTNSNVNVLNTGSGGMNIDGSVSNSGRTLITNKAGDLNLNGQIKNSDGMVSINNYGSGTLSISDEASISNTGTGRTYVSNYAEGGMNVNGEITGDGHILLTNRAGGMNITSDVTSDKANIVLSNSGDDDMVISGTVKGSKITATNRNSNIVLGNTETEQAAMDASGKVSITVENGSILNAGVKSDLIRAGGNLYMNITNGTIGEDVVADNPIGKDSRDLKKSINVDVAGSVAAYTTDENNTGDNYVINIASKGKDLNINRIKADGKVILLTDVDEEGNTGSILNAATNLDSYANVKGTSIQMISSGSIGTEDNAVHFRQTDANQQSNILAVGDVNLHARGEASGEDVNFGIIKSKEGSINVDLIKDGVVENAIAAKDINITSRRQGASLKITNKSHDTSTIKDYFDEE